MKASGNGTASLLDLTTVRNLVLRSRPPQAPGPGREAASGGAVRPLALSPGRQAMHQVLFAHGWNPAAQGLPCKPANTGLHAADLRLRVPAQPAPAAGGRRGHPARLECGRP